MVLGCYEVTLFLISRQWERQQIINENRKQLLVVDHENIVIQKFPRQIVILVATKSLEWTNACDYLSEYL